MRRGQSARKTCNYAPKWRKIWVYKNCGECLTLFIDYEKIFESDPTPRVILQKAHENSFYFLRANKNARAIFNKTTLGKSGFDTLFEGEAGEALAREIEQFFFERKDTVDTELRYRDQYHISITMLDESDQICELRLHALANFEDALKFERDDALSMLSSIFEVSEVGIIVTDAEGKIVNVNKGFCRIYGWMQEDLHHQKFEMLIAPEMRGRVIQNHERFIKFGIRSSGEMKVMRADGSIADTLCTTATLSLSNNRKFQVTTITDISIRKRMENSLRNAKEEADIANKAKSTFLANMSHELRTPLNAIIGFSEMMMQKAFGPIGNTKYEEYLTDVHFSATHLLQIINEVLDMSKIEAGRVKLEEDTVSIKVILQGVMRFIQLQTEQKNITFETEIANNLPDVKVDVRLMKQVMINILTNAIKYTDENGLIKVRAQLNEARELAITVTDNGVGIPDHKIRDALEPFGQISNHKLYAKTKEGTGLGLPIAKGMMELHGGSLLLSSIEGKGTRVDLILPANRLLHKTASVAVKLSKPLFLEAPSNEAAAQHDTTGLLA